MDRTTAAGYATVSGLRAFQNANPPLGISQGTDISATDLQAHQEEIMAIIAGAGIAPNAAVLNQAQASIAAQIQARLGNVQAFTASGTFTVPANVTTAEVEVWGGGPGSGACYGSTYCCGGTGAGAGYARKLLTGLVPGTLITVTVGAGGAGGTAAGVQPVAGGLSSFGSYVSATGGGAGANNGGYPGSPGTGVGGDINLTGGRGGTFWGATTGLVAAAPGVAPLMPAGQPTGPGDLTGAAAVNPGCAGSPATTATATARPGGAGCAGLVIVRW